MGLRSTRNLRAKPRRRYDDATAASMSAAMWESVRGFLLIRCGGRCESCGAVLEPNRWSAHHRDSRGMGGTHRGHINALSNLLVMCGSGTTDCHGWTHANPIEATRMGWMLPTAGDVLGASAGAVVVLFSGRRVLLDPLAPFYLPAPGEPYDLTPTPLSPK